MELIVSLKNINMINKLPSNVEGIVLGCDYSFYANNIFSLDEINLIRKKYNKKIFILINLVMHNEYRKEVREFISQIKDQDFYFIFQDLGVLQILNELGIIKKGIYNPLTMITNYNDLLMYDNLGVDAVGMSSEIPLSDIEFSTEKSSKIFYLGFGYHPMYQTYRKLASLYKEYSGLNFKFDHMKIKELSKDAIDLMIENKFGSIVFRSGVISILEQIEKVNNVKYLFLDGIFLDEEVQLKVYDIYSNVLDKKITKEEGLSLLNELNLPICNKFINEDSVYNPEDF